MPPERAALAAAAFKDPYILDFVELAADAHERHLEAALIERIRQFLLELGFSWNSASLGTRLLLELGFSWNSASLGTRLLLELGKGFAFLGSQYHLGVDGRDYYIDLLFYHTRLHSYIVVDLKLDDFKPEYAGKISFYLSAVDAIVESDRDERSIGLLLCRGKDGLVVEYALRSTSSPIVVSDYTVLPAALRQHLPSPDDLKRLDEAAHRMAGLATLDAPPPETATRAELAERVEDAARAHGHDLPPAWAETLARHADETSLRAMVRNLDRLGDDLFGFISAHGVDWPERSS